MIPRQLTNENFDILQRERFGKLLQNLRPPYTAIIVAKILGLSASDVLGSQTQFLARLAGQEVVPPWKE